MPDAVAVGDVIVSAVSVSVAKGTTSRSPGWRFMAAVVMDRFAP